MKLLSELGGCVLNGLLAVVCLGLALALERPEAQFAAVMSFFLFVLLAARAALKHFRRKT